MRVKQFDPKFIAKLKNAGFYIMQEAFDRNMIENQDFGRSITIDGRDYFVIIGIFQSYDIINPYKENVIITSVDHKQNGQLVFDIWPMDEEDCDKHQKYIIDTVQVLDLIKEYGSYFLIPEQQ